MPSLRPLLSKLSGILFLAFAFALPTVAQMNAVNGATTTPPPGEVGHDYIRALEETVDPSSGQVSLRLQLPIPEGRGPTVPFAIAYDSSSINYAGEAPSNVEGPNNYEGVFYANSTPIQKYGWTYTIPNMTFYEITREIPYQGQNFPCSQYTGYIFQDPSGGSHNLKLGWILPAPACVNLASQYTTGGDDVVTATLLHGGAVSALAHEQNGTVYSLAGELWNYSPFSGGNYYAVIPPWIEDRNGNKVVTSVANFDYTGKLSYSVTDTLGRTALSASGFGATGNTVTVSGISTPYTLTWSSTATSGFSVTSTSPGSNWDNPANGCLPMKSVGIGTVSAISAITLPNEQEYKFSYDPVYGEISKVTYPSGGYVSYSWGLNEQSSFVRYGGTQCGYIYDRPAVLHRYVSFDGTTIALQQDFSYATTWQSGTQFWSSKQTTVTTTVYTPDGNKTTYTTIYSYNPFSYSPFNNIPPGYDEGEGIGRGNLVNGDSDAQFVLEGSIVYKDSSGNVLRTVNKGRNDTFQLNAQQTILENGMSSQVNYYYVPNTTQINEKDEYDYGQSSPSRKTITTYQSFAAPPIYPSAPSILNLPSSVVVDDGSGNRVAETDYTYDGTSTTSPCGGCTLSGHDETNYAPSSTAPRGNLTKVTKWLNTGGTSPVETYTYDETGQQLTKKDANGNATTYSYLDSYTDTTPPDQTDAYLTKTSLPTVNGVTPTFSSSYAYSDGQMTVSTDQNGNQTKSVYNDSLRRLTEVDFPDGGKTSYSYNDSPYNPNTSSPSVTTTKVIGGSAGPLVSVAAEDGFGHTLKQMLTSDPQGTTYTVGTYDGLGRKYQVYNPTRCSPPTSNCGESTWGVTTYFYDALDRSTVTVPPDGTIPTGSSCPSNDVCTSYSGNTTTVTDEAGHSREWTTDGLGRLTQAIENPGGLGYVTNYTYDTLNDLTNVLQNGSRSRTFTYNSLSEMTSSATPEANTVPSTGATLATTYSYDADGNLTQKTMPAQNQQSTATITLSYCYDALNRLTGKTYTAQ